MEPIEWIALGALVVSAAGAGYSAYSSYEQGKAQQREMEAQAEAQAELARRQAAAQHAQAQEYERQAQVEVEKAGVDQLKGQMEAERRSRLFAAEVGSTYANAAGNGLLIDGSDTSTFANVLKSQNAEAQYDIGVIRANTAMDVWTRSESARNYLFAADQARRGASDSLFSSNEYLRSGYAQGANAAKAGTNAAIGTGISAVGQIGSGYVSAATTFGKSGQTSVWNPGGSTSKFYKG